MYGDDTHTLTIRLTSCHLQLFQTIPPCHVIWSSVIYICHCTVPSSCSTTKSLQSVFFVITRPNGSRHDVIDCVQEKHGHLELTSQLLALVVPRCCDIKKPVQLVAVDCFEAIYLILLQSEGQHRCHIKIIFILNGCNLVTTDCSRPWQTEVKWFRLTLFALLGHLENVWLVTLISIFLERVSLKF